MLDLGWALAGREGIAAGMNSHNRSKDPLPFGDPSRTDAASVAWRKELAEFCSNRRTLDKILELDQRTKVLSQCILREVEDNQELRDRVEGLESDRQSLLKALEKVANRGVWFAQLVFSELPSPLRTELIPLVHPFVRPYAQSVVDGLEHIPTNKQIPDTKEVDAGIAGSIPVIDQLLVPVWAREIREFALAD